MMINSSLTIFIKTICVFGLSVLFSTLVAALYTNKNLLSSDDVYSMGFLLACFSTIPAFIYFFVNHINSKHRNSVISMVVYFIFFGALCLSIKISGSVVAELGFYMLTGVGIFLPILIIALRFSNTMAFRIIGLVSLLIYGAGFIYVERFFW